MAKPTVRVRIAFADGPYVASPTWTDVTSYVRAVNTSRGRTDDWQDFDSGTATVVLDNRTRRFDPTYTAGPYYGNLQPRRQIYIDATTDGGSTYKNVFRGYIDSWPVTLTAAGFDSTVTVNCYDTLGLISQNTAPYDWADAYIRSLNPIRYIKCDDIVDASNPAATKFTDYGSINNPLVYESGTAVLQNIDSIAPGLPYKAVNMVVDCVFSSTNTTLAAFSGAQWLNIGTLASASKPFVATGISWKNVDAGQAFAVNMYYGYSSRSQYEVGLTISTGALVGGTTYFYYAAMELDPSKPHHFAYRMPVGYPNSAKMYVDGIELVATMTSQSGGATTANDKLSIVRTAQQVVAFNSDIGASAIRTIYNLSIGQITETTAARFSRALGQTSVPAALYSATASPAGTVAKINNGAEPIRNTIQYAGDSEGGEIYVGKDGVLYMTNRTWYQGTRAATSQATFGSGGLPIGTEMTYSWSANGIRNALNMSWSGDTTVNVTNATSIAAYGTKQDNYETQLSTAADTQTLGNLLVNFGQLPRLVMSAVQVNQALSASQWATVLDLELLDRITVAVPEKVGTNLTQTQIVQQIEHSITPGDWQTTILGSSRWSSVFVLNSSVLDGVDLLG